MGLPQEDAILPTNAAMYNHWIGTIPWLWTLAGLTGVALFVAFRRGGVPRWIGLVGLVLGGLTLLLGVSPLQYMAGMTGPLWLLVTALGFVVRRQGLPGVTATSGRGPAARSLRTSPRGRHNGAVTTAPRQTGPSAGPSSCCPCCRRSASSARSPSTSARRTATPGWSSPRSRAGSTPLNGVVLAGVRAGDPAPRPPPRLRLGDGLARALLGARRAVPVLRPRRPLRRPGVPRR